MAPSLPALPLPAVSTPSAPSLGFDQRACFIAGPARSGTTLLAALLDGHPELLVLPEETAYFPTVLTKYGARPRREQFDYLTTGSLANVLFGGECKWARRGYPHFPTRRFREEFARRAFDPHHAGRDLLVLLMEAYAEASDRPLTTVRRWVERTPANRDHLATIFQRFPHARILLTLRDPRALLASQIQLERTRRRRRFSAFLVVQHWLKAARLVLRHRQGLADGCPVEVVEYQELVASPAATLRRVRSFLGITQVPGIVAPTKMGLPWGGNSAADERFDGVSLSPAERWRQLLTPCEVGWIEWHCRPLMERLGYEPLHSRRRWRHWTQPVEGETPREYAKSRFYSLFGRPIGSKR